MWASRRFCAACARRFRRGRVFAPLLLSAALVVFGFLLGRAGRPSPPPLTVERGALTLAPPPAATPATAAKPGPRYGPDGTAAERPTEPDEAVSFCGARTKKGTPCRRRVRGAGRCWQHRSLR